MEMYDKSIVITKLFRTKTKRLSGKQNNNTLK